MHAKIEETLTGEESQGKAELSTEHGVQPFGFLCISENKFQEASFFAPVSHFFFKYLEKLLGLGRA